MSKKHVAATLTNILENPLMVAIQDKTEWMNEDVINRALEFWKFDLLSMSPGIAYPDEGGKVTTLDLATFLWALTDRNAVINLPSYKGLRGKSIKEGESVISAANRHGKMLNLTSNKESFTFGIRMEDMNVMTSDADGNQDVGGYRTFLMTDLDGGLYDGWKRIDFVPTADENKWITENNQADVFGRITFDHFVNPNRWISFYGQYYFIAQALLGRLLEERSHLKGLQTQMINDGVRFPDGFDLPAPLVWPKSEKGETKSVKIWAFESEIDIPEYESEFPEVKNCSEDLRMVYEKVKLYNKAIEKLRYLTRTIDFAFAQKHAVNSVDEGTFVYPAWISGSAEWEQGFKFYKGRKQWNRLKIMQPGVGELSVALRFRWYQKSQRVALDAKEPELATV